MTHSAEARNSNSGYDGAGTSTSSLALHNSLNSSA